MPPRIFGLDPPPITLLPKALLKCMFTLENMTKDTLAACRLYGTELHARCVLTWLYGHRKLTHCSFKLFNAVSRNMYNIQTCCLHHHQILNAN